MTVLGHTIARAAVDLLRFKLDKPVGGSGVASVDVIVAHVATDQGIEGFGLSYVLAGPGSVPAGAAKALAAQHIVGQPLGHPFAHWRQMKASFARMGRGPMQTGMAAIDVALWDLYAKALDLPLGLAMGGTPRAVPVYGSGGFSAAQTVDEAMETAKAYGERGILAIKPRVSGAPRDLAFLEGMGNALGPGGHIMLDANGKCTPSAARRLSFAAREVGALWLEEPLPPSDLAGYRALARAGGAPIAAGESIQGLAELVPFIDQRLCDVIQPDLGMTGLSESLKLCTVAEALGVEVAPHFLPSLFVHLAAASPAVSWLEDFPLLEPLLDRPLDYQADGTAVMLGKAGHGFALADGALKAYRVDA